MPNEKPGGCQMLCRKHVAHCGTDHRPRASPLPGVKMLHDRHAHVFENDAGAWEGCTGPFEDDSPLGIEAEPMGRGTKPYGSKNPSYPEVCPDCGGSGGGPQGPGQPDQPKCRTCS